MADIDGFKSNLIGGGARANQFLVQLNFPPFLASNRFAAGYKGQFLCKAAQLPGSTIDKTPVNYRGREVKFAGERVFAPWRGTILNDTDFLLRNMFEAWMNGMNNHRTNNGITDARQYQGSYDVFQLDRNGARIKGYRFADAFPTEVSPIELSFDQNNEIETFDVTFEYNYWTSESSTDRGVVSGRVARVADAIGSVLAQVPGQ